VDRETCTPRALFRVGSLPQPSSSLYLVLRIEQVARGDPDNAADPYFKHATVRRLSRKRHRPSFRTKRDNTHNTHNTHNTQRQIKQKERAKFIKELEASCDRLGKYTQPFAWSAVQVRGSDHFGI
jgi:hypothetical protein